ncbi:MAG: ABC transporter permease [Candidatus Acidiferrales bacterium]
MRSLQAAWRRLRSLFQKDQLDRELQAELASHLEMHTEDNLRSGMTPEDARRVAVLRLGGVEQTKESVRYRRGIPWLETLFQDLGYGLRVLGKNPVFTTVAVITLALGIGTNTAIFSMVDAFLFRPLPVIEPGQITKLAYQLKGGRLITNFSMPDYRDIREQTREEFSGMLISQNSMDGLSVNGKANRIVTNYVAGDFFSTLGIKPALGRFLLPSEEEAPGGGALVLGYSYWRTKFHGDSGIIGKSVSVNGHPVTIVDVAPEGFRGLSVVADVQGYLPLGIATIAGLPSDFKTNRGYRTALIFGRLRPGVSLSQAQASLDVVAKRLSQENPVDDKDLSLLVFPELRSRPHPDAKMAVAMVSGLFLGLSALVLVLACVNVANILLVRATVREREMAIRAALGARRSRLIQQLLTESILLSALGGIAGILLGYAASASLGRLRLGTDTPLRFEFGFDWRVFGFALGATLITGIIVGIVPAIRASGGILSQVLHERGRGQVGGRWRARNALVAAQVGGSLILLIIAGLFTRSLGEAQRTNLGFDPNHVVNFFMDPTEIGDSEAQGRAFLKNLVAHVRGLPGVMSVSTANSTPLGYYNQGDTVTVEGYEVTEGQPTPFVWYNAVSSDYFRTLGIPILRGRSFTDADDPDAQFVAIVNEAMAKKYWPGQDPIGRQFKIGADTNHSITVAGVAKSSRFSGVTGTIQPYFYVPFAQHYQANTLTVLQVRTVASPGPMIPEIEQVIGALAPELPVFDVKTMSEAINTLNGILIYKLGALLAAALGTLGLVLALVGIYGVVSFAVSQKTHEIGVRIVLGAHPRDVLRMILGEGLLMVTIGLVIGLVAAFGAARVLGSFLTVSATDPFTYVVVSAPLALVALIACYVPARRATHVDPAVALRCE